MLRAILGVIVGYLVMAGLVMGLFVASFLALGAEKLLQPGSFSPSNLWLALSFVISLLAATVGGVVCVVVSRSRKPPFVLAGLIFVFGLLMALFLPPKMNEPPKTREGDVKIGDAMQGEQPTWVAWLTPIVGACGVLVGGRWKVVKS